MSTARCAYPGLYKGDEKRPCPKPHPPLDRHVREVDEDRGVVGARYGAGLARRHYRPPDKAGMDGWMGGWVDGRMHVWVDVSQRLFLTETYS